MQTLTTKISFYKNTQQKGLRTKIIMRKRGDYFERENSPRKHKCVHLEKLHK